MWESVGGKGKVEGGVEGGVVEWFGGCAAKCGGVEKCGGSGEGLSGSPYTCPLLPFTDDSARG